MPDTARKARAEARRKVAVLNRTRLQPVERDLNPLRGGMAVSLVARLTRESWSAAGKPFPSYSRREITVKLVPGRLT